MRYFPALLTAALLAGPAGLNAQVRLDRFPAQPPETAVASGPELMRVAKWSTLAASAGLAVYGFVVNADADDEYDALEQICVVDPERCADRAAGGAYVDPVMEQRYQDVLDQDRRARWSLLASQVGVATSVLLFILDLRETESPPNIPFDPPSLSVHSRADGGVRLELRLAR